MRAELLGLDVPRSQLTEQQKALQLILLAMPLERIFAADDPIRHQLEDEQRQFFDLRVEWFKPRCRFVPAWKRRQTVDERLTEIAARLLYLNDKLTARCIGWRNFHTAPPATGAELEGNPLEDVDA
jgi:hypothetical protein